MLAAVGIWRVINSCEEMATRDSVWIFPRGMSWWRVAKNASRACIHWWALGELLVQVVHNLCWKKDVGVLFGDLRQRAQKTARMSGRTTGGDDRRCE